MSDATNDILEAAGLNPRQVKVDASAPHEGPGRPAILLGRYGVSSACVVVLATPIAPYPFTRTGWSATATISLTVPNALAVLSEDQRERLRYDNLEVSTPEGLRPAKEVAPRPRVAADPPPELTDEQRAAAAERERERQMEAAGVNDLPPEIRDQVKEGWG